MLKLSPGQNIHLVGIGGAGLSAIARILLQRGFHVSGSDLIASEVTAALENEGARVFIGHAAENMAGVDLVLATSAVTSKHVEVRAALESGVPVYSRREFLTALLDGYQTIAVAGTHGKTTTTSMIAHILREAGQDPSYIVGGIMGNTGVNAAVGVGNAFVIEADEYGHMFLGLHPLVAVVTNIEHEHVDYFPTHEQLVQAFEQFVESQPTGGTLVASADDDAAAELLRKRQADGYSTVTYGIIADDADWKATDLQLDGGLLSATIVRRGAELGILKLKLPGAHNVLNALAALIVAESRGVSFAQSAIALLSFKPTARRFEIRGIRDDVIIVDDYAHHPTEIHVNLEAARQHYPEHQIWAIWQPHTYSRVRRFWRGFTTAFAAADHVLVTPIYAAREISVEGINSPALVEAMHDHPSARYVATFEDAVERLEQDIKGPAVVLICSAGDANQIADLYLKTGDSG